MSNRRFPVDCPPDCPYHAYFDMSIDEYTHVCRKLNMQMDEEDIGWLDYPACPFPGDLPKEVEYDKNGG